MVVLALTDVLSSTEAVDGRPHACWASEYPPGLNVVELLSGLED